MSTRKAKTTKPRAKKAPSRLKKVHQRDVVTINCPPGTRAIVKTITKEDGTTHSTVDCVKV